LNVFREPTRELPMPNEIRLGARRDWLGLRGSVWTVDEAEALLEVLLDICPNAKALAHNWLLEEQKREHMLRVRIDAALGDKP
jgi:hypothetical protein